MDHPAADIRWSGWGSDGGDGSYGLYIVAVAVAVGSQRQDKVVNVSGTTSIDHFYFRSTDSRAIDNWCRGISDPR